MHLWISSPPIFPLPSPLPPPPFLPPSLSLTHTHTLTHTPIPELLIFLDYTRISKLFHFFFRTICHTKFEVLGSRQEVEEDLLCFI